MRDRALVDGILRPTRRKKTTARCGLDERLADEARFFRTWVDAPGLTGAVSPSGRFLARAMARPVDPNGRGLVVELGPGTGPVTEALLDRGVVPERLIAVEYSLDFCKLLRARFPKVRIVQGDAYRLSDSLRGVIDRPVSAVVSSLPLLNRPEQDRLALLHDAFDLMGPDGLFVQFTYGIGSPIPLRASRGEPRVFGEVDAPVWLNIPPARVWRYRRTDHYARTDDVSRVGSRRAAPQIGPALALIRKIADGAAAGRSASR